MTISEYGWNGYRLGGRYDNLKVAILREWDERKIIISNWKNDYVFNNVDSTSRATLNDIVMVLEKMDVNSEWRFRNMGEMDTGSMAGMTEKWFEKDSTSRAGLNDLIVKMLRNSYPLETL